MQYLTNIGFFKASASTPTPPFAFDNALEFDGSSDVSANAINIGGASTTQWTLSFWLKTVSISSAVIGYPFAWGSSTSAKFILQDRQTGEFRINFDADNIQFASAVPDTGWHHYLMVFDGTQAAYVDRCKLWRDGSAVSGILGGTGRLPASMSSSSFLAPYLGRNTTSVASVVRYFDGTMDEVALWVNYAGTRSDATALYNGGAGEYADSVIPSPERYYRLNGSGTDTTAIDSSGNGNDGSLNNFIGTYWVTH